MLEVEVPVQVRPGEWLASLEFFDDLYHLCGLALFAAPPTAAQGLGEEVELAWREYCAARTANIEDRQGLRGSADRGMAGIPSPALMAVAIAIALPLVLAPSGEERQAILADLLEHVRRRQRRALDRARNESRLSPSLKLALLELTIEENQVLAYLRNHPQKGRRLDLRHYDDEITPELIGREFPVLASRVKPEELVLPMQVMLRFFLSSSAQNWSDVFHPEDPPTVASKVLRLVNLAGAANLSRELARWVVELGSRDPEYDITFVRIIKPDGDTITWQERMPGPFRTSWHHGLVRREKRSYSGPSPRRRINWSGS